MPNTPHYYSLKKEWDNEDNFCQAVQFIRDNGKIEFFKGYSYTVLYIENYKYWTMGSPIDQTILINRAKINES